MIGSALILLAWTIEALEAIKKHKSLIDLKFAMLYAIAISFLIVYSYQIGDPIFFWFQAALLGIVLFEIAYTIAIKKVHRR